jgi:hypothetical protein
LAPTPSPDVSPDFFRELQSRGIRYMIVGMAAVALQGGNIVTDDIDLWVENLADPGFHNAARALGGVYIAPTHQMPPMVSGRGLDQIDLVVAMSGLGTFEQEYRFVRWIALKGSLNVPVLSIERIVVSKRAANRPKDRAVLPIVEDLARALAAVREIEQEEGEGLPR